MQTPSRLAAALGFAALLGGGCDGSVKANNDAAVVSSSSGIVVGPLDHHCGLADGGQRMQSIGVCQIDDSSSVPASAAGCGVTFTRDAAASREPVDAAAEDAGAGRSEYGDTMYGSAGDDDDCKYYVSWVATPIQENVDTYFTVTALRLADGKPANCAGIRADVSLTLAHGATPPRDEAPEIAPGVYKVGPIRFDAPGQWTVRFHLYEQCNDTPDDSPHGHAAFYVQVR